MITHNSTEVMIHRCLLGERLTPEEKELLRLMDEKGTKYCEDPRLHPDIGKAITGQKYRKVDWQDWVCAKKTQNEKVPAIKFCKMNPGHLVVKDWIAGSSDTDKEEKMRSGFVYISEKLFEMAKDSQLSTSDLTIGVSRLMEVFNVSEDWGKICIPAHPVNNTVKFSVIDSKTDPTLWNMPPGIRKMESAKYVPRKRRKLLPGIVQRTIKSQNNARVVTIGEKHDIQTEIFKQHVMQTTVGKELMAGPGNGQEIINILFEHWWSPHAIQKRLREERQ